MNAISPPAPVAPLGTSMPDGSLVITPEQLARFGDGDARWGRKQLLLILEAEKDQSIRSGPTARPANVRIAVEKDERAVFDLLIKDLEENATKIAPINRDRVAAHLMTATRRKGGVCGVIDGPDGKPVAVTLMAPHQWWWSSAFYFQEVVLYVDPDHRKSKYATDLLNFERWWTDNFTQQFGYRTWLMCGVTALKRGREKAVLYRRRFAQVAWGFLYPNPMEDDAP